MQGVPVDPVLQSTGLPLSLSLSFFCVNRQNVGNRILCGFALGDGTVACWQDPIRTLSHHVGVHWVLSLLNKSFLFAPKVVAKSQLYLILGIHNPLNELVEPAKLIQAAKKWKTKMHLKGSAEEN